uniref:Uncharacterized protein n=1 Tax=Clytia hemisphaerica TaxID=252671 RepID=A0A7M5UKL9_9CNID
IRKMKQGCAVEDRNYCKKRKDGDPGILSCKAYWCYNNKCNFPNYEKEIDNNKELGNNNGLTGPSKGIVVNNQNFYEEFFSNAVSAKSFGFVTFICCLYAFCCSL